MDQRDRQHDAERRAGIERRRAEQHPRLLEVDADDLDRVLGPAPEIELPHQAEIFGRAPDDAGLARDLLAVVVVVADAPLVLDEAQAEIERVRQAVRGQPLGLLHLEGGIARHHHPAGRGEGQHREHADQQHRGGTEPAYKEHDHHRSGDHQPHHADRLAHQRRQREEDDARGDPQVGRASRQQAHLARRQRHRQHGGEAHQADIGPVRRGAHPAEIFDRPLPQQHDRGDVGAQREQQAGQGQQPDRVGERIEARHVDQVGVAARRHRPQAEQQRMARIVGDGALRHRHQLSLLADGEPDAALERAVGGGQPHVGGLPVRRHEVGVVAVALGVRVGVPELAQHEQGREHKKDQAPQCSPCGLRPHDGVI